MDFFDNMSNMTPCSPHLISFLMLRCRFFFLNTGKSDKNSLSFFSLSFSCSGVIHHGHTGKKKTGNTPYVISAAEALYQRRDSGADPDLLEE